ncbi:hypothetical protein N9L66_00480 [Porticoccaceae bacterium]|nr:hypothetical protein [Porticoccaceae bacterium]MDA8682060.1 hypothetical protein [Porticoccaceae bacterium]MDB2343078.1 hypothetical protein [Porticoccaceae bacterium]MDB2664407.1 hypothetical protein [Porticoccaceae bacterium]
MGTSQQQVDQNSSSEADTVTESSFNFDKEAMVESLALDLSKISQNRSLNAINFLVDYTSEIPQCRYSGVVSSSDLKSNQAGLALVQVDLLLAYVDKSGDVKVSGPRSVLDEFDETNLDHGYEMTLAGDGFELDSAMKSIANKIELKQVFDNTGGSSPLLDSLDEAPDINASEAPVVSGQEAYDANELDPPPFSDPADPGFDESDVPPSIDELSDQEIGDRYSEASPNASAGPGERQDGASTKSRSEPKATKEEPSDSPRGEPKNDAADEVPSNDEKKTVAPTQTSTEGNRGASVLSVVLGVMAARAERKHIATQEKALAVKAKNYTEAVVALDKSADAIETMVDRLAKTNRSQAMQAVTNSGVAGEDLKKYSNALAADPVHEAIKQNIINAIKEDQRLVSSFIAKADGAGIDSEKAQKFIEDHSETISSLADEASAVGYDESFTERVIKSAKRIQQVIQRVYASIVSMKGGKAAVETAPVVEGDDAHKPSNDLGDSMSPSM